MKQVDYQKVQLCILAMLILYGVALMLGVQVPAANIKGVDRVVDLLVLLLSAQHLAGRIQNADNQPAQPTEAPSVAAPPPPPVPISPEMQDLINFQKAVQKVAAAAQPPESE